jgi:hypothetical protein
MLCFFDSGAHRVHVGQLLGQPWRECVRLNVDDGSEKWQRQVCATWVHIYGCASLLNAKLAKTKIRFALHVNARARGVCSLSIE